MLPTVMCAQTSVTGQWSAVQTWPSTNAGWVPTHAVVLPTGKVLYYSSYGDGLNPHFWDPATNAVTTAPLPGYNIFCSGHSFLADGKLFVTGGHIDDYVGYIHASIYDPFANTWTQVPDMNAGRWYPTNTTLANGDVLVVSGTIHGPASAQVYNDTPQVYQRASNSWRTLTSAVLHLQLYPFMFLAPNGKVFLAGWNPDTRYIDPSGTGSWSFVATSIHGWRNYGSAVMYDVGKIMIVGGDGDGTRTTTNTAEVIDLNAATPAWKSVASMANHRRQQNATVLPDGTVLVTGGSSASGFDNPSGAIYAAEVWNPATNTWSTLASAAKYRGYHSFALLLPDARVLTGGGQINQTGAANGANAEVFSPPYLFKGARPTITSAPTSVNYGQTTLIGTSDSIAKVSWIRLSAVTHSYNQEQRFMPLSFTSGTGGINVTFPASANISPPGYYMLFLLNSAGVPSVAKIINIGGSGPPPPPGTGKIAGKITNISTGGALSGATVSYSGGSATSDASGNYALSNVATGTYKVTAARTGFLSRSSNVTVTSNTTSTANFALATAGKIAGVVKTTTGAAISGVTVKITGGKVATTVNTTTNSTGNYGTTWISMGTYTITISKTGRTTQSKSATVNTGATTTVNFTMQ